MKDAKRTPGAPVGRRSAPPGRTTQPARSAAGAAPRRAPGRRAGATRYRAEPAAKARPTAVAAKLVVAVVFAATAALCAHRAASPGATPHSVVPDAVLTVGFAAIGLLAAVLCACAVLWALRGARFADNRAIAVVWPIATVLLVIAAGLSTIPQHYLRAGLLLVPAGALAVVMMAAVAVAYNRAGRR